MSVDWYSRWKEYTKTSAYHSEDEPTHKSSPGPMNNEDVVSKEECYRSEYENDIYNVAVVSGARIGFELKVLTREQWEYLYRRYGGVALKRRLYKPEGYNFWQVDSGFVRLNLVVLPARDEFEVGNIRASKPIYVGSDWSLKEVRDRIIRVLNGKEYGMKLDENNFRLWRLDSAVQCDKLVEALEENLDVVRNKQISNEVSEVEVNTGLVFPGSSVNLNDPVKCIEKLSIDSSDTIIMELRSAKGEFIFQYEKTLKKGKCDNCFHYAALSVACRCKAAFYCSAECLNSDKKYHLSKCSAKEDELEYKETNMSVMGEAGLQNLGNTCYMNSGLQCLSNTTLLSRYFLNDLYAKEVNLDNPLGSKGEVVSAYARLLKALWYGTEHVVTPHGFKQTFGEHHKNFEGLSQQDSQEFISTLADSLHEDLNRVKVKPYIENKTTADPEDNSMADEAWYNHLARNQSIIVDLMHGQYKSVVHCPSCKKYSVAFDPFSSITLPLPSSKQRVVKFTYVPYNLSRGAMKGAVKVDKKASVDEVREKVGELLKVRKYGASYVLLSANTFDRYLCREQKSKVISKYNSQLYIQEINPKYFTDEVEKKLTELIKSRNALTTEEVKKEGACVTDDSGVEKMEGSGLADDRKSEKNTCPIENHDDDNNGLPFDLLRLCINIYTTANYSYWNKAFSERRTFNRLVYVRRSHSLKQLHLEVFAYLRPLFDSALESEGEASGAAGMSDEELFEKLFEGVEQSELPYELRVVNVAKRLLTFDAKCFFCGKTDCENCLVPSTENVKVQDLLDRMGPEPVKNDYYYFEHRFYNADKREFELEVCFNTDKKYWRADLNLLDKIVEDNNATSIANKEEEVTIDTCLAQFSNCETLDEDNLWYCATCNDSVKASKRMEILRCPPILVLHLKRFKVKENAMFGKTSTRLNALVNFPLRDLDLSPYIKKYEKPPIYDLYAVSNHYGSIDFGHYTAFAMNRGIWHEYDDSGVAKVAEDKVCTSAAYVLFYRLRGVADDVDPKLLQQKVPQGYVVKEVPVGGKESHKEEDKEEVVAFGETDDVIAAKKEFGVKEQTEMMEDEKMNDELIAQICNLDFQDDLQTLNDDATGMTDDVKMAKLESNQDDNYLMDD